MQIRLKTLLDTCTYVVFNYTRRGLFDRDKLIVLTLLTFHIMLKVSFSRCLASLNTKLVLKQDTSLEMLVMKTVIASSHITDMRSQSKTCLVGISQSLRLLL